MGLHWPRENAVPALQQESSSVAHGGWWWTERMPKLLRALEQYSADV